jgi:class 3 adenylate cyclase
MRSQQLRSRFLGVSVSGLPRRNYIPRTIGFTLLGILSLERWWNDDHTFTLLAAAGFVVLWPHLALLLAAQAQRGSRQKDEERDDDELRKESQHTAVSSASSARYSSSSSGRAAEYRNLYADAFLGGCCMSLYGFSLWQTQAILAVLCANNMSIGGVGLFLRGFVAMLGGVGITLTLIGFQFRPESSLVSSVCAILFTFAYIVFTNYVTFRQARSLISARKKSEYQRQEISRQSEILAEQAREIELANSQLQEKNLEIEAAHNQSNQLLLNILPHTIALRLMAGEQRIADRFEEATVMFADIADFTTISATIRPEELVGLLDTVFSAFDAIASKYSLEKIKTIGDCYMLVGGLPEPQSDHCKRVAQAAVEILGAAEGLNALLEVRLSLRIGIHTGPVVAGVIGTSKFAYDLWGDTVNTASRMESQGEAGKIHCTEAVFSQLHKEYTFEQRGEIEVKGKGMMQTWFLTATHNTSAPFPSSNFV